VAVSDSAGTLASPRTTVLRTNDVAADRRTLVSLVLEVGAGVVVIGLPLSLRGDKGTAAKAAAAEAAELAALLEPEGVGVELFARGTGGNREVLAPAPLGGGSFCRSRALAGMARRWPAVGR
jgi:sugar phosphate isomerase/epimerase